MVGQKVAHMWVMVAEMAEMQQEDFAMAAVVAVQVDIQAPAELVDQLVQIIMVVNILQERQAQAAVVAVEQQTADYSPLILVLA
jgi:hypothetical protein